MDIDLNIDNYDLKDLINLFGISYNFSDNELKQAKKIVLKMHPDKSGLDKKYFLFFSSAYKIIHAIYKFRHRTHQNTMAKYETLDDERNDEIIKNLFNQKNIKKDFNKWFNELFEKTKIDDEYTEGGYGDWLKSNEDMEEFNNVSKQDIDEKFEEKKKKVQSLIIQEDFKENETSQYELTRERPQSYSSDLFSNLNFEDLKKAHQESVIPITKEDYLKKEKLNLEELKNQRSQKIAPSSLNQANDFLNRQKTMDDENNVQRAYKLVRQDEKTRQVNDLWWSNIKHIL